MTKFFSICLLALSLTMGLQAKERVAYTVLEGIPPHQATYKSYIQIIDHANPESFERYQLFSDADRVIYPSLHPELPLVTYSVNRGPEENRMYDIVLENFETGQRQFLTINRAEGLYIQPRFSNDGKKLLFSGLDPFNPEGEDRRVLFSYHINERGIAETSSQRIFRSETGSLFYPSASFKDSKILVLERGPQGERLLFMDPAGLDPNNAKDFIQAEPITTFAEGFAGSSSVSFDGERIAYLIRLGVDRTAIQELRILDLRTKVETALYRADPQTSYYRPQFLENGELIFSELKADERNFRPQVLRQEAIEQLLAEPEQEISLHESLPWGLSGTESLIMISSQQVD